MLTYFQTATDGNIQNVPICAEYCDAWFDACQDDLTCFENWLEEYDPSLGIANCPAPFKCHTFHEVYRDGRGLCDTIWGTVYAYSTDADNCTVMAFNNTMPNPNYNLTFPKSASLLVKLQGPTLVYNIIMSSLLVFLLVSAKICWKATDEPDLIWSIFTIFLCFILKSLFLDIMIRVHT